jgi:phosphate starvation-inducible PhoH-like protein
MKEANRQRKNDIKYKVTLNEEQKIAKSLIYDNQIVIVTGRAGSGKSLVCVQTALDFLNKGMLEDGSIFVTRAMIETDSDTMGFLKGDLNQKFNPYMEAFIENAYKCMGKETIDKFIAAKEIVAFPVNFIRGKTIEDVLIVEEAQNLSKAQMLAILTRLGKTGKIIINGDNEQQDLKIKDGGLNGLQYAIELSKKIPEIQWIKLKANHRSDLVGKILDYEYGK